MTGDGDPDEPGRTDQLEHCAHCGAKLPMEEWRPVATTTTDDGETRILSFCDDSCKEAVLSDEDATSAG